MGDYMLRAEELTGEHLEAKALQLYDQVRSKIGTKRFLSEGLSFQHMFKHVIQPETGITILENCDLGTDPSTGQQILGSYSPSTRVARIDARIAEDTGDPRRAFTLWHEVVGHGWLQTEWMEKEATRAASEGATGITTSAAVERILEWQANMMAGLAAVPTPLMEATLCYALNLKAPIPYVGPREYWLEDSGVRRRVWIRSFDHLCLCLADRVKRYFVGLSSTAIAIRIASSRWVARLSDASKQARSLQIMDCDLPELVASRHN